MANSTVAQDAIDRSRSHTEAVFLDWDAEAFAELTRLADERNRTNEGWEFFCADPDSEHDVLWRIEMLYASDDDFRAFRDDAAREKNDDLCRLCDDALEGDEGAVIRCRRAIEEAARSEYPAEICDASSGKRSYTIQGLGSNRALACVEATDGAAALRLALDEIHADNHERFEPGYSGRLYAIESGGEEPDASLLVEFTEDSLVPASA
ncbi:MAG: hypothetical protein R3337_00170 [Gammaproteobacteria bacterium]|nr:hypothetical protein [Gammaproteobacteria bacterium]